MGLGFWKGRFYAGWVSYGLVLFDINLVFDLFLREVFIYSFISLVRTGYLLCVGSCVTFWGYCRE